RPIGRSRLRSSSVPGTVGRTKSMNFMAFLLAVRIAFVLQMAAGQRSDRRFGLKRNAGESRARACDRRDREKPDANGPPRQGAAGMPSAPPRSAQAHEPAAPGATMPI